MIIAVAGVSLATAALAQSLDAPMRRPGLWEQSMAMPGVRSGGMTMKYCTDTALEKRYSVFSANLRGNSCSKAEIHRTPMGVSFQSVCNFGGATRTTTGTATGDFQSNFHMEAVTHSTAGADSHISMDGKWLGPCPADMRPGDTVMPNGMKMNIDPGAR
jgi:hypothetical protein